MRGEAQRMRKHFAVLTLVALALLAGSRPASAQAAMPEAGPGKGATAFSAEEQQALFLKRKARISELLSSRLEDLQTRKSCVDAADSLEALRKCGRTNKAMRRQERAEGREGVMPPPAENAP